jgi:hypothetical protein
MNVAKLEYWMRKTVCVSNARKVMTIKEYGRISKKKKKTINL